MSRDRKIEEAARAMLSQKYGVGYVTDSHWNALRDAVVAPEDAPPFVSPSTEALAQAFRLGKEAGIEAAAQEVGSWAVCGDKHMARIRALAPRPNADSKENELTIPPGWSLYAVKDGIAVAWKRVSSPPPHQMDAPDGPVCGGCGKPSRHESGWCGECVRTPPDDGLADPPSPEVAWEQGYRRGVEDAVKRIREHSCDDPECRGCSICNHATEWADDLESLAPPSTSSAASASDMCRNNSKHGYGCDLPSGHDGEHRSYSDPDHSIDKS